MVGGVCVGVCCCVFTYTSVLTPPPFIHCRPTLALSPVLEGHDLAKGALQRGGEGEEPQRVARGGGVEHDGGVVHALHLVQLVEWIDWSGWVTEGGGGGARGSGWSNTSRRGPNVND